MSVSSGILVFRTNPPDIVRFIVENEMYSTNQAMHFNSIAIASSYIIFNTTGFYVASDNDISITLVYIDDDITGAGDGDKVLEFYASTTDGKAWFNISGFPVGNDYVVNRDDIAIASPTANGSGYISFSNDVWSEQLFEIFQDGEGAENKPPYVPGNPNPEDGATDVSINADLSWAGGDPDPDDTITYDVCFGTTSPPPQVVWRQSDTMYDPGTMNYNTQYFWKIVAWDNHGEDVEGPIWSFTTMEEPDQPPYVPSNPNPEDHATNVSINVDLSWTGGDPDPGDTVTYDVFFGTSSPPHQVTWNQPDTTYNPGTFNYEQTYYWKIIAWDNHGELAEGPIWDFTTEEEPNNSPYVPGNPNPPDEETDISINTDLSWTGGDPDPGDTVTYDVYLGTISHPPKMVSNQSDVIFDPELNYNTTYYWKIIAWDDHGASTDGAIWRFETAPTQDTASPEISDTSITMSDPADTQMGFGWENITCTVRDNVDVDEVFLNITYPDSTKTSVSMINVIGTYNYYYNTSFSQYGNYSYSIWANDTSNNVDTSSSYTFSMPPNWDINNDGECNIYDYMLVSSHYGETGVPGWIREDVDNNGKIQVFDLVLVSEHYDESWWA